MLFTNSIDIKKDDLPTLNEEIILKGVAIGIIQNMSLEELKTHFGFEILNKDSIKTYAQISDPKTSLKLKADLMLLDQGDLVRYIVKIDLR